MPRRLDTEWWDNFVSETVIEEEWRENFRMSRKSLYKLANELRVNSDTCGRANSIWIRICVDLEIFESAKKNFRIKNIGILVDGAETNRDSSSPTFCLFSIKRGIWTFSCRSPAGKCPKKKAWCTYTFVVLLIKYIAFLKFLLPSPSRSPSSDPKVANSKVRRAYGSS